MRHGTRRGALRTGALVLLGSLAGCTSPTPNSSDTGELTLEQLDVTAVYVSDGVDVSMPSEVSTVDNAYNAQLLILPDDTTTGAEQVIEWLADDRVVAVLGEDSEATWLSWARSDAFRDTFGNEAYGDSEPDPALIVAARNDVNVKTYRRSWSGTPRDRDVVRALDETLVTIETETPAG